MRIALWSLCLVAGLAALIAPSAPGRAQAERTGSALVLKVTGVIGPAVSLYLREALADAPGAHDLVILEMDTPGGLDTSMREMIQAILASRVPVATFVSPSGSRAASAGTYILYASHVAAMAPSTTLGAATPIQLGGGGGQPSGNPGSESLSVPGFVERLFGSGEETQDRGTDSDAQPSNSSGETSKKTETTPSNDGLTAAQRKAVNDAAAYIRGLAIQRGRNAEWAEEAVRKGVSLDSSEAVEINVIDLVARDIPDLLAKIDGRTVEVEGVGPVVLETEGLRVVRQEMTWIQELLAIITNPNIAFVLMQLGVLGLIIELYNPGAIFPGVVGVVCLLLGLTALAVLPVSVGGLALLLAGLIFMALELFVASGGILAVVGAIAFGFGAFFLFDTDVPEFRISLTYLLISTVIMAGIVFAGVTYALAAQRRKVVSGAEALIGATGVVIEWDGTEGMIRLDGEMWKARSAQPLSAGQDVVAERIDGLTVWVRPK